VLARRGRGQDHGLAVEVDDGGSGGEPGKPAGFELDGDDAERPVVYNGFGGIHTLHG